MRCACRSATFLGSMLMLLVMAEPVQAQFPIAVVAGPTFGNVSTDEWETSSKTGFFVGVGTLFPLNETFSVRPFISYTRKGVTYEEGSVEGEDTYDYIEIPVLIAATMPVSERFSLTAGAGPQVAFNLSCTEEIPGEADFDCKDYDNYDGSTEFGLVGTVGVEMPMGDASLGLGVGVDYGLTDVFDEIEGGYQNRVIFVYASYGMLLGGGM
jgi:hypothetical protein